VLSAAGFAAAGLVAGGGGVRLLSGGQAASGATQGGGSPGDRRRAQALRVRTDAARRQSGGELPERRSNGDEGRYPPGLVSFSKSLPHNRLGEVDPDAYRALLGALASGRAADFEQVKMGGAARLANPQGAFGFELEGADPWKLAVAEPPAFSSESFAGEMTECYWLALARDVSFSRYGQEPITTLAVTDLRRFDDFRKVDARTVFRSDMRGVAIGPYVSQFLLQPYTFGSTPMQQRYRTTMPGDDHLTSYQEWLDAQNGKPVGSPARFDPQPRYIRNGRDLAEWAHRDFSYQGPLVAALILLDYAAKHGRQVLADSNPYRGSATQAGLVTFGAGDVLDLVARVANHAMKAAWHHKWLVHRRLRPEEAAGRVHNHLTSAAKYSLHPKLTESTALPTLYTRQGTYLCPQAYPEGCPTHPAYPGATAAIGGAGVTALKAFFNESFVIPDPVVASDDGLTLRSWKGEPLTVGGELNKLAFNMAFGRDLAGVHFRRDELRGILLGETAAFSVMADQATTYHEAFDGFTVTGFDGTATTI
jgi:hypothetical protein